MIAVEVENLSKVYRFYQKPAHRLLEAILRRPMHTAFGALEDITFSVPAGSTLGIIGENGAGKSTLLKILAKTLSPTSGKVKIQGRVAALLELGAGFHQEFTGRQNIYLNASLMGMTDKEITSREEEIIAFADIGDFIDRPIKTYSSGMAVRLAFSIATSVDPDILVIDEALSVGDQRFQEKCVERMIGFRNSGKTIVICSHSMYLVNELCNEVIWLSKGTVQGFGQGSQVISQYLGHLEEKNCRNEKSGKKSESEDVSHIPDVTIEEIDLVDFHDNSMDCFVYDQPATVRIKTKCRKPGVTGHILVGIESMEGKMIFVAATKYSGHQPRVFKGEQCVRLHLPKMILMSGTYRIKVVIGDGNALRPIHENISKNYLVNSPRPEFGMIRMEHEWVE